MNNFLNLRWCSKRPNETSQSAKIKRLNNRKTPKISKFFEKLIGGIRHLILLTILITIIN